MAYINEATAAQKAVALRLATERQTESWQPRRFPHYSVDAFGEPCERRRSVKWGDGAAETVPVARLADPTRPLRPAALPTPALTWWHFPRPTQHITLAVAKVAVAPVQERIKGRWWTCSPHTAGARQAAKVG